MWVSIYIYLRAQGILSEIFDLTTYRLPSPQINKYLSLLLKNLRGRPFTLLLYKSNCFFQAK